MVSDRNEDESEDEEAETMAEVEEIDLSWRIFMYDWLRIFLDL